MAKIVKLFSTSKLVHAVNWYMKEYALFVGIMWNRIGTPTPRAESGTVEEFERAIKSCQKNGQAEI